MLSRKFRIAFLRLWGIPVIFLAVFVRPGWSTESTPAFCVEFAGYVLVLAGLAIRIWSILYIGGRKSDELITEGPYSLCRNPLYVGTFLVALGVGLCFENILMLVTILAAAVPVHLVIVPQEEANLARKFPLEFPEYQRRVRRFRPRLAGYHTSERVSVSVRSIWRVLIDTSAILMLPQLEDLLELLHDKGILPVLWYFPGR